MKSPEKSTRKHASRIFVYDIAAESGGALSVLRDYHDQAMDLNRADIEWYFAISTPNLQSTSNIKILRFPWIKKSILHRAFFDYIYSNYILNKYKIDYVVSLQNITLPFCSKPQIVSLHNVLPLSPCNIAIMGALKAVIKQFFVNMRICKSLKKADAVIAPAKWIRDEYVRKFALEKEKWFIAPMRMDYVPEKKCIGIKKNDIGFFYPSFVIPYKSHNVILRAFRLLQDRGIRAHAIFTDYADRNKLTKTISNYIRRNNLAINFVGCLTREEVYDCYSKMVLLFPSFIETDALPLKEAMVANCYIIAADTLFSREILDDYPNCDFFKVDDATVLSLKIEKILQKDLVVNEVAPVNQSYISRPVLCLDIIEKIRPRKLTL
ncbi:MAG: glycosyltransferase [Synergistaceae bacterium]